MGHNHASLMQLSHDTAHVLTWHVRILHGRFQTYPIHLKNGDLVTVTHFVCYLVGHNPSEYVQATVRHNEKDAGHLKMMADRYSDGTVWQLRMVSFYQGAKPEWIGAPNKHVVVLDAPSVVTPVAQTSPIANQIATYLEPKWLIKECLALKSNLVVDLLKAFSCSE